MSLYIAVDFDGTIVDHQFPEIGKAVPGAFDWLKRFKEAGATLILWTMRSDGQEYGDVLTQRCGVWLSVARKPTVRRQTIR